jgi:outer membrane protein assembly factor BamB
MFGIDAQHTHAIPTEHILTPQTVSHLIPGWTSFPTGGSLFSSPVVADGIVYIGSLDGHLYAYKSTGYAQSSCVPSLPEILI